MKTHHFIYECDICGNYHPWEWSGDCREDENRFANPEEYSDRLKLDPNTNELHIRSMTERVAADRGEEPAFMVDIIVADEQGDEYYVGSVIAKGNEIEIRERINELREQWLAQKDDDTPSSDFADFLLDYTGFTKPVFGRIRIVYEG